MSSPIRSPKGVWWRHPLWGQEKVWLAIVGVTMTILFGWMVGWMYAGEQNPTGPTYRVTAPQLRAKVTAYKDSARQTEQGLVPAGEDVYIVGFQWGWDGLPVVLEAGKEYRLHLGSYDVQHGFSVRPDHTLWKQVNLQLVPGYEWVVPFTFDEPGTYHVICNEFCGYPGHRVMHGTFVVTEGGASNGD